MLCKCLVTCLDYKRPVSEKQSFFKNYVKNLSILMDQLDDIAHMSMVDVSGSPTGAAQNQAVSVALLTVSGLFLLLFLRGL